MLYPADPPTVAEIVCVMCDASDDPHGFRLRAMIVMLWRGGLRVTEALALSEQDLDRGAGRCSCAGARARSGPTIGPLSNEAQIRCSSNCGSASVISSHAALDPTKM
jgi:site-specific recombinase XerD